MKMLTYLALGLAVAATPALAQQSDARIKREIVRQSVASHQGSCPCPYSLNQALRSCGRDSVYSRTRGAAPRCYRRDVTAAEVEAWRAGRR